MLANARHYTQIDPDREISDRLLELIGSSDTDAVIYAGSSGINPPKLREILGRSQKYIPSKPKIVAPSHPSQIPPEFFNEIFYNGQRLADKMWLYFAVNATNSDVITGWHAKWLRSFYEKGIAAPFGYVQTIGYVITNPDVTAAKIIQPNPDFSEEMLVAYGELSAELFEIVYYEGSPHPVSTSLLRKARAQIALDGFSDALIVAGGGIENHDQARDRRIAGASAINVGGILSNTDLEEPARVIGYLETIAGAKHEEENITERNSEILKKYNELLKEHAS